MPNAEAYCPVETSASSEKKPGRDKRFKDAGAQLIGPAAIQRYRTTFESKGGDASLVIRGIGYEYQVWLNGRPLGQGAFTRDEVPKGYGKQTFAGQTVAARNVLAVQITSRQPHADGDLWTLGFFYPQPDGLTGRIGSGTGWRTSSAAPPQWMNADFDDHTWPLTDLSYINCAYDGGADVSGDGTFTAYFICPGEMYFRRAFRVKL